MEQGLTAENGFAVDRWFVVFLLAMVSLFVLAGLLLSGTQWGPADYVTFW